MEGRKAKEIKKKNACGGTISNWLVLDWGWLCALMFVYRAGGALLHWLSLLTCMAWRFSVSSIILYHLA